MNRVTRKHKTPDLASHLMAAEDSATGENALDSLPNQKSLHAQPNSLDAASAEPYGPTSPRANEESEQGSTSARRRHAITIDQLPDVATASEVAQLLRLSKSAVHEAAIRGDLSSLRIGRRVLFPKEALLTVLPRPGSSQRKGKI
jgi:excisionase family DNA binding protein